VQFSLRTGDCLRQRLHCGLYKRLDGLALHLELGFNKERGAAIRTAIIGPRIAGKIAGSAKDRAPMATPVIMLPLSNTSSTNAIG
jgi:hypothetical protein